MYHYLMMILVMLDALRQMCIQMNKIKLISQRFAHRIGGVIKPKVARLMIKDAIKKLYELTKEIANKHL
jgi:hypothetical protein